MPGLNAQRLVRVIGVEKDFISPSFARDDLDPNCLYDPMLHDIPLPIFLQFVHAN